MQLSDFEHEMEQTAPASPAIVNAARVVDTLPAAEEGLPPLPVQDPFEAGRYARELKRNCTWAVVSNFCNHTDAGDTSVAYAATLLFMHMESLVLDEGELAYNGALSKAARVAMTLCLTVALKWDCEDWASSIRFVRCVLSQEEQQGLTQAYLLEQVTKAELFIVNSSPVLAVCQYNHLMTARDFLHAYLHDPLDGPLTEQGYLCSVELSFYIGYHCMHDTTEHSVERDALDVSCALALSAAACAAAAGYSGAVQVRWGSTSAFYVASQLLARMLQIGEAGQLMPGGHYPTPGTWQNQATLPRNISRALAHLRVVCS